MTAFLVCSLVIIVYFEVFALPLPLELSVSSSALALGLTLCNVLIAHGYAYRLHQQKYCILLKIEWRHCILLINSVIYQY